MTETRRIVRTISPVTIQLGSQPSKYVQIYFQVRRGGFDFDKRSQKDPSIRNVYRFMVDAMEYDSTTKLLTHIKNVSPIEAEYKMSTFRSIFGGNTINDWFDTFPEQIISQIDYTSTNEVGSYFGLKEADMEIVEIELN
tara:strand:+ start:1465 stop:1881 length:417 start_codon:yes stop_codon:yes gene_type:complete